VQNRRPAVLVILDGWGEAPPGPGNAVALAHTPVFDRLRRACPFTTLAASGSAVGLPEGQIGNSEVGHLTLGAGRILQMDLPRIDAALAEGRLQDNPALERFLARVRTAGGAVHLAGLASDGGVHSRLSHALALAEVVAAKGLPLWMHLFLDARDVPPGTAPRFLAQVAQSLPALPGCRAATVSGRYFAMDRDRRWSRTRKAWDAIALGSGEAVASLETLASRLEALDASEEFLQPAVLPGYPGISPEDGLLSANFRVDRMRQLFAALVEPTFAEFSRAAYTPPAAAASMTPLSEDQDISDILFPAQPVESTLGRVTARHGRRQLRIAETEKYPHVTYFMNGGREAPEAGEERFLAPSPKVATYDLAPEMSAAAVGDRLVAAIREARHDLVIANFANPDMVGHSGRLKAAIRAVETVDRELGRVVDAVAAAGGVAAVTADHGNAEQMVDPGTGRASTAHSLNPVPFLLAPPLPTPLSRLRDGGGLSDVAPTMLRIMGLETPPEMTGAPLLKTEIWRAGG